MADRLDEDTAVKFDWEDHFYDDEPAVPQTLQGFFRYIVAEVAIRAETVYQDASHHYDGSNLRLDEDPADKSRLK